MNRIGLVGLMLMLTACGGSPQNHSAPTPTRVFISAEPCLPIQRGIDFLRARYNPSLGLFSESPVVAPHTYWLTNDNALAAFALARAGNIELASAIDTALSQYGSKTNGLIEIVWGVPVAFPPRLARPVLISKIGVDEIWQEYHDRTARFDDWSEYTNLALLGALNEYHQGHTEQAESIFAQALRQFDGTGFHDKAYLDHYETYKLALALYVGSIIHAPMPTTAPPIYALLLAMQAADGGFTTLYRDRQTPLGDANTETTAFALLALATYGCEMRKDYFSEKETAIEWNQK